MCRVSVGHLRVTIGHLIGQLRVGKDYLMVNIVSRDNLILNLCFSLSKPKENLSELNIIVRITGFNTYII